MMKTLLLLGLVALIASRISANGPKVQEERNFTDCDAKCGGGTRVEPSMRGKKRWTIICNTMPCDLAPPEGCGCAGADIIYVVDRSNSIHEPNYWRVKQFMMDFANAYGMVISDSVAGSNVRVAAVTFDKFAQTEFDFNAGLSLGDRDALMDKIWGMKYEPPEAGTNTPAGLNLAREILDDQARPDKPQIVFIITDGKATKRKPLPAAIDNIHSNSTSVFALGIGNINDMEIGNLVKNEEGHGFIVNDFGLLHEVLTEVLNAICCKSVKKECDEKPGECKPECGPGELTVSGTCNVVDSDGNVISTDDFSYEKECCNGPCPDITDYCTNSPCSPGNCTERSGGYKCSFPPPEQCP